MMRVLHLLFAVTALAGTTLAQASFSAIMAPPTSIQTVLPTGSQQPAGNTDDKTPLPRFTARTELVTVPVVVLHNHSPLKQLQLGGWIDTHVEGLKVGDFEIHEDGEPRPIASFEEVRGAASTVKAVSLPPGTYTNALAADGAVTVTVLLLDNIFTPYQYQHAVKEKLLQYLRTQYRGDRPTMLAVLDPSGLRIVHDFTSDPQVLVAAAQRIKGTITHDSAADNQVQTEFTGELSKEIDVAGELPSLQDEFTSPGSKAYEELTYNERLAATFDQLQQLAHALAGVRGMKSLIWATAGFRLPSAVADGAPVILQAYYDTLRLLTASHVAVYPIDDVLETSNPAYASPQGRYPSHGRSSVESVQRFWDIAKRTGGDWCLLRKDPDLCFQKAADFGTEYYLLSYYTRSPAKQTWRTIDVKVHGLYQVRTRNGYLAGEAPEDPELRRKRDIALAFSTPVEMHALPVTVRWTGAHPAAAPAADTAESPEHRLKQPFTISITADALAVDTADHNHIQLSIVVAPLDDRGKMLTDLSQRLDLHASPGDLAHMQSAGFVYSNQIDLPPRTAHVRFIVRDDLSERIGTVSAPLP